MERALKKLEKLTKVKIPSASLMDGVKIEKLAKVAKVKNPSAS